MMMIMAFKITMRGKKDTDTEYDNDEMKVN
jgi:hypothetical protein